MENSLDAGASAITVEIRDGGISYFRVTDNGSGIPQTEIRMAFERHATSKITESKDLFALATLGFRGEALASIAAVSHVTCTTRTAQDVGGIKVQNDGGTITSISEAACPEGTTFVVRDLFYNTPVRLKFLKKPSTEAGLVSDLMMRLILSRPDVSFRYINQGKVMYHSAGDGKLESAVFSIYGNELLRSMRKVDGCERGVVLKGYVGVGESGRGNRAHQSFFINGRYMRSSLLSAALEDACRERVMIGKYPACVLHLTMPCDQVDVNVHPNKLEVRFANEQAVGEAVMNLVRDAITDRDALAFPTPMLLTPDEPVKAPVQVASAKPEGPAPVSRTAVVPPTVPAAPRAPIPAAAQAPQPAPMQPRPLPPAAPLPAARAAADRSLREPGPDLSGFRSQPAVPPVAMSTRVPVMPGISVKPAAETVPQPAAAPAPAIRAEQVPSFLPEAPKPLKIIGVVFNTYILVEYEEHLLMIDQHAVHERLLFDRWMKLYDTQRAGQELLVPMICTVTRREQELLEEHRQLLERIGLVVEPLGDTEVSIRTIPMLLGEPQTRDFLHELLAQLESERGTVTLEKRRAAILQTACKHAVKGGEKLTDDEIRDLVSRMIDQKVTPTCPHGRPLVVALARTEMEKKFRRIQ